MVSKRSEIKTERLAASCEHKRRYTFSNAFRLTLFALFEIFWVYMSANLICKQTLHVRSDVIILPSMNA